MTEFVAALFSFPAAIYTGLLGIAVLYWLLVIIGAVDIDLFGSGAEGALEGATQGALEGVTEGVTEGVAEGVAEGVSEGVAEGVAEGVSEGVAEGASEGAGEAGGEGAVAHVLGMLGLRRAPATVVFSLFSLTGWALCMVGALTLGQWLGGGVLGWLYGSALLAVSVPVALLTTSLGIRPLAPLFVHETQRGHAALVGKTCLITTGRVDERFGQGLIEERGSNLLLQVRAAAGNGLRKHSEALIVDYDPVRDTYQVEAMARLLDDGAGQGSKS